MRKDLEGHVRGVLKVFGICMSGLSRANMRQGFRDQLTGAGAVDPAISAMVDMLGPIHMAHCSAAEAMDVELRAIARKSSLAVRLMTVRASAPSSLLPSSQHWMMLHASKSQKMSAHSLTSSRDAINLARRIGLDGSQNAEIVICGDYDTRRPRP